MDSLFVTVIAATLAREAQRAAVETPKAPKERRGWDGLRLALLAQSAAAPCAETCAPAPAR